LHSTATYLETTQCNDSYLAPWVLCTARELSADAGSGYFSLAHPDSRTQTVLDSLPSADRDPAKSSEAGQTS
jgi:hypothetical protein